ncbi:hypothetical protein [Cupriavidus sp. CP313]
MQDATRRPLFAHSPSNQGSRSFAKIDAIDVRRLGLFAEKPIARLISAFLAALPRFRLAESRSHRDDDAVKILSNAGRMEMITRSQWKIGAHSGGAWSQLQHNLASNKGKIVPNNPAKTTYRAIPATRLLRDRQVGQSPKGTIQRFGFIRLVATQWHQAATLLIDWDRAVNEGWPNLRWSLSRNHSANIRRFAGSGN